MAACVFKLPKVAQDHLFCHTPSELHHPLLHGRVAGDGAVLAPPGDHLQLCGELLAVHQPARAEEASCFYWGGRAVEVDTGTRPPAYYGLLEAPEDGLRGAGGAHVVEIELRPFGVDALEEAPRLRHL
eukprot:645418-Prorocentrum_minimum.AAC.3